MNAKLRLVKEDGSLASVVDLVTFREVLALEGRIVALTAVDISQGHTFQWQSGTAEQTVQRARNSIKCTIDALKQATSEAESALASLSGEPTLDMYR
jgi:hypothetical protein